MDKRTKHGHTDKQIDKRTNRNWTLSVLAPLSTGASRYCRPQAGYLRVEEIDINSNIETVDKIAGAIVADRDKTARAEAIHDKIAEEAADDNTIDPSIELAVPEAVDRVGEEANEIIVIDSITETIIDKIAEEVAEFLVEQPIEAIQAAERIDKEAEGPRFKSSPQ